MSAPTIVVESYELLLWERLARNPAERDRFLEEFTGLSLLIGERQTAEEWIAEAIERWCYRPPVSAHLIDNHSASRVPDMFWGPGPAGRYARALARVFAGQDPRPAIPVDHVVGGAR